MSAAPGQEPHEGSWPSADDGPANDGGWPSDEEGFAAETDPYCGPPDGADAWLVDLPGPERYALLDATEAALVPEATASGFTHGLAGGDGPGFAAGGVADKLSPGPVLAGLVADVWQDGVGKVSDDELIGLLLAARRLCSWQAAMELAAVTELDARRVAQAAAADDPRAAAHTSEELAVALTMTGRAADTLLGTATSLAELSDVMAALADGAIDRARATIFADELAAVRRDDAIATVAHILPRAGALTTGQLRAALHRAVLAIDPEAARRRRKRHAPMLELRTGWNHQVTAPSSAASCPPQRS